LAFVELENNIVLIGFKKEDYTICELNLFEIYPIEKNMTVKGVTLYGDIFALKKINNRYYGLTNDEIDSVMSILNTESRNK